MKHTEQLQSRSPGFNSDVDLIKVRGKSDEKVKDGRKCCGGNNNDNDT